jgi:sugar phosphate isomerase/epimerase
MQTHHIRIGLWVDDLKQGVKEGLKSCKFLQPEIVGLDAFSPELAPRQLSQSGRRDLSQFVRSRGAVVAALRADIGGRRLADREHLDANLTRLRDALQLAADLHVPHVVVPAGYIPAPDSKNDESTRSALFESARALANFSSQLGVQVCWMAGSESAKILAEFLKIADPGSVLEVDLNPAAFTMRGEEPLVALNELAGRVTLARVADHYRGGSEAPFGKGDVRWGEVIVGLSTLNRGQPLDLLAACTLDGDRSTMLGFTLQRLRTLRENPMQS